jgi:DNA-binding transcriptional ArsR family regulator
MNVLNEGEVLQLAEIFRLMGEPNRLSIILAVHREDKSVGQIAKKLGQSASLVSHHLRLLRAARILKARRQGKQVFYSAADQHVERVIADMTEHVGEWAISDPGNHNPGKHE